MVIWNKLKRVPPLLGALLLAYIIMRSGPEKILEAFLSVDTVYLVPAALLIIPYFLLQAYKWRYILDNQKINLRFTYLLKLCLIGTFYSTLTPGRLGTFIRVGYIKDKTKKSLGECSINVVLDKAMDILSLLGMAIIGIALFAGFMLDMSLVTFTVALFLLMIAGLMFFMKKKFSSRVMRIVHKLIVPARMKSGAKEAFDQFYENMPRRRSLLIPFIATTIGWIVAYASSYCVALSLGIDIPFYLFVTIFPIATLIGLIPVTVSGWGTREAALIGLFSPFNISASVIIVLSILSFVFSSIIPSVIGAVLSLGEK